MNYATESDHHVRKTVRSLRRTLGLLTILAVEVTAVYALPPETCDLAASTGSGAMPGKPTLSSCGELETACLMRVATGEGKHDRKVRLQRR
jgi:hypothetical protein